MKTNVREMVKMAMYVVLFVVLDYISAHYIPRMPQGGSWGIGTTVLIIAAYDLGMIKAMGITSLVLLLSFWYDPPYFIGWGQYALDYLIGYMAYSLVSVLPRLTNNKKSFYYTLLPVVIVNGLRFLSSTVSGVVYYNVGWVESVVYQSMYMVPTLISSVLLVPILFVALQPFFNKETKR